MGVEGENHIVTLISVIGLGVPSLSDHPQHFLLCDVDRLGAQGLIATTGRLESSFTSTKQGNQNAWGAPPLRHDQYAGAQYGRAGGFFGFRVLRAASCRRIPRTRLHLASLLCPASEPGDQSRWKHRCPKGSPARRAMANLGVLPIEYVWAVQPIRLLRAPQV